MLYIAVEDMRVFNRKYPTFDLLILKRKIYPNRIRLLNICEYTLKMCSRDQNRSILRGTEPAGCGHWSLPFHPACVTVTLRPRRSSCCWSCYCQRLRLRPSQQIFPNRSFFHWFLRKILHCTLLFKLIFLLNFYPIFEFCCFILHTARNALRTWQIFLTKT